jgi:hypothetical protein
VDTEEKGEGRGGMKVCGMIELRVGGGAAAEILFPRLKSPWKDNKAALHPFFALLKP